MRLLYLGAGGRELRKLISGLTYHVSEHRREFVADRRDVPELLRRRGIVYL